MSRRRPPAGGSGTAPPGGQTPAPPPPDSCGTCHFYQGDGRAAKGRCRRGPPTVQSAATLRTDGLVTLVHGLVWSDGWCGEYRAAE